MGCDHCYSRATGTYLSSSTMMRVSRTNSVFTLFGGDEPHEPFVDKDYTPRALAPAPRCSSNRDVSLRYCICDWRHHSIFQNNMLFSALGVHVSLKLGTLQIEHFIDRLTRMASLIGSTRMYRGLSEYMVPRSVIRVRYNPPNSLKSTKALRGRR